MCIRDSVRLLWRFNALLAGGPALVVVVEQRYELGGGLAIPGLRGMTVPGWIGEVVARAGLAVLNASVPPAVVVTALGAEVVRIRASAVTRQYIVEIEYCNVIVRVAGKPLVHQPICHSASIRRLGGVRRAFNKRRRNYEHEQLVLMGGEIGQDVVVYPLDVGDGHRAATLQWVVSRFGRVVRIAIDRRVRKARLEHHDLVCATRIRIRGKTCVTRVLSEFVVQSLHIGIAFRSAEPVPPITRICPVADYVRSPTVVRIADEVVVVLERNTQTAVLVCWPGCAGGRVCENE